VTLITLNEDGCKGGYFCSARTVYEYATNATYADGEEYMCEEEGSIDDLEESDNAYASFDGDDVACGTRNPQENLVEG
jgi:hypothetical protein